MPEKTFKGPIKQGIGRSKATGSRYKEKCLIRPKKGLFIDMHNILWLNAV
jgi:hypothetical protein